LVFQDPSLDERLTAMENLRFHALLYSVPSEVFRERAERLLEMVDLADKKKHKVRTFSGGMKRRLEIARGLLHHPDVLFLDEPTIGLDPQTRKHIWDYLRRLRDEEGITMFMTTHYMDEAENCDRIAIIDHGKIVALDSPDGLRAHVGGDVVTLRTSDDSAARSEIAERWGLPVRGAPGGGLIIETEQGDQFIPELVRTFGDGVDSIAVKAVNLRRPTIDDVFIKLTGHAIREQEANAGKEDMRQHARMTRRG
jgi:ABC-2 type transport system ATP-binding protein